MSIEKIYQPTKEEIQKAKDMMTKEEKNMTKEREETYEAGQKSKQREVKEARNVIDFFIKHSKSIETTPFKHEVAPLFDVLRDKNISKINSDELKRIIKKFPEASSFIAWNKTAPGEILILISESLKKFPIKDRRKDDSYQLFDENRELAERLSNNPSTPSIALEKMARLYLGDKDPSDYIDVIENLAKNENTPVHILKEIVSSGKVGSSIVEKAEKNLKLPLDQRVSYKALDKGEILVHISYIEDMEKFPKEITQGLNSVGVKVKIIKKGDENFLSLSSKKKIFIKEDWMGGGVGPVIRILRIFNEEGEPICNIGGFSLETGIISLELVDD